MGKGLLTGLKKDECLDVCVMLLGMDLEFGLDVVLGVLHPV